jgi:release factor glutamine methyltransferase
LAKKAYEPHEDSILLRRAIENVSTEFALEIGCGTGFVLESLSRQASFLIGADIDKESLYSAKKRIRENKLFDKVDLVCCDSASAFRKEVFDLVVFNPPYLPSEEVLDRVVDGGLTGTETTLIWIKEAQRTLKSDGMILFVTSSLADKEGLLKKIELLGFEISLVSNKKLFFEDIMVFKLKQK